MGHKNACFNCRKAFTMGTDFDNMRQSNCPECGQRMTLMTHRFRPPKKEDDMKWQTVRYLVDNGFTYQRIYEKSETNSEQKIKRISVEYPENLRDAKDFVTKYLDQAQPFR